MTSTGIDATALKAKIEQTRAAREAFLRNTGTTTTTPSSQSSSLRVEPTTTTTTESNKSAVSMIRDNFNREISGDKASVQASLTKDQQSTANKQDSHFYQNLQQIKQQMKDNQPPKATYVATNTGPPPPAPPMSELPKLNGNHLKSNSFLKNSTPPTPVSTAQQQSPLQTKTKTLDGYVGFANLPNQVYRKSVKKGFEFNLMVIGESALGKSTFINSLFLTELYNPNDFPGTFERKTKTTTVDSTSVLLTEKGVTLRMNIIDTPGFGDGVDNSNSWQPIIDYIDARYEDYLSCESKVNRKLPINDQRIHCCLYFISPGHTLKQLDIEVMKRLHDRVNLIPVIAKADTMTSDELKAFKSKVLNVISEQQLQVYEFPDIDDDDAENNRNNSLLKSKQPFAVIGSDTIIESKDGKQANFRGRQYPWGVVNVDELNHCDFIALRTMLIRTHMQDLKDVTNNVHYENYRFKKLAYVSGGDNNNRATKPTNKNPFQQLEEQRKESELRLEDMKREMESVFDQKVKEKVNRLKESELSLEKQQEAMRQSLEKEERELEDKRIQFLREKQMWEDANREDEERFKHTLEKEADKKKKKIF